MAIQIAMPEMFGLGEYVAPDAQGMHLEAEEDHRRWELIGDPVVLGDPPPEESYDEFAERTFIDPEADGESYEQYLMDTYGIYRVVDQGVPSNHFGLSDAMGLIAAAEADRIEKWVGDINGGKWVVYEPTAEEWEAFNSFPLYRTECSVCKFPYAKCTCLPF